MYGWMDENVIPHFFQEAIITVAVKPLGYSDEVCYLDIYTVVCFWQQLL